MNTFESIESIYGIKIIPAQIIGHRWSCIDKGSTEVTIGQSMRIPVSENYGLIVYGWQLLNNEQRKDVVSRSKEVLYKKYGN